MTAPKWLASGHSVLSYLTNMFLQMHRARTYLGRTTWEKTWLDTSQDPNMIDTWSFEQQLWMFSNSSHWPNDTPNIPYQDKITYITLYNQKSAYPQIYLEYLQDLWWEDTRIRFKCLCFLAAPVVRGWLPGRELEVAVPWRNDMGHLPIKHGAWSVLIDSWFSQYPLVN